MADCRARSRKPPLANTSGKARCQWKKLVLGGKALNFGLLSRGKGIRILFESSDGVGGNRFEGCALLLPPDKGRTPGIGDLLGVLILRRYHQTVELFGFAMDLIDGIVRGFVDPPRASRLVLSSATKSPADTGSLSLVAFFKDRAGIFVIPLDRLEGIVGDTLGDKFRGCSE